MFALLQILIATLTDKFFSIISTKYKLYETKRASNMKNIHRNQPVRVEIEIL